MQPPSKGPEGHVTILDERDIDRLLRRVDELYLSLVDMLIVNRRFVLSLGRKTPENVVPMHARYPQSRSPDERERP